MIKLLFRRFVRFAVYALYLLLSSNVFGSEGDTVELDLVIQGHRFVPEILKVESGKKIILNVHNRDETIEEFESIELKREKIVPGKSSARIVLAPLKPGIYNFIGEFHADTAKGTIVVQKFEE